MSWSAIVLVVCIAKYGIGLYPSWNYMTSFAQNWRHPLDSFFMQGPNGFRLYSPVEALFAGAFHLIQPVPYVGFSFYVACGALIVPLFMPAARRSPELRLAIALLLIGGTVVSVLFSWVGSYDPVTIAAASIIGLADTPLTLALGFGLTSFNNTSQAALAFLVFGAILIVGMKKDLLRRLLFSACGLLVGSITIDALVSSWGGTWSPSNLISLYPFSRYWTGATDYWPLIMLSTLGVGWVFMMSRETWRSREARTLLLAAVAVGLVGPFFALDETRIVGIVMWPALLVTTKILFERMPRRDAHKLLRRVAPVAVILPVIFVSDSLIFYPGPHSISVFFSYLFNNLPIPAAGI